METEQRYTRGLALLWVTGRELLLVSGGGVGLLGFGGDSLWCSSPRYPRLIRHTPSYCDESLFGSRPEGAGWDTSGMARGDAAKLRALFWTPPATPRDDRSPRPRETPLRAIHPVGPSKTEPRVAADSKKLSLDGLDATHPLGRGRSHSLTHLNVPSTGHSATSALHTSGPRNSRPSTSGVTFRSSLVTPRARSVSISVPATPTQRGATPKPKPPWK